MKKKLLCVLLSTAMVFTTGDFSAFRLVHAEETYTVAAKDSARTESTTTQTETTEESVINSTSGVSKKPSESESNENGANTDDNTIDETETEDREIDTDTTETKSAATEESIIEDNTTEEIATEGNTAEENTREESTTEETTIMETEETTETETEETNNSKDQNKENAADTERSTKLQVAYHSVDEIKEFLEKGKAEKEANISLAEDPSFTVPYKAGVLSDDTLESAAAMINQIRFIAGLPYEVTVDKEYSQYSQAAAFVNYINGELSHEPAQPEGMSEELYEQGQKGASNSNLAYKSSGSYENTAWSLKETILDFWMADEDSSNIDQLEHRRWILNPSMGKVGFGAVKGSKGTYSAIYATDSSGSDENIFGVAWPAQNTPIEYFDAAYPWSVSTGESLEATEIEVTLTRKSDGKIWHFAKESADGAFSVDNGSYGQTGCIIFRPNAQDIEAFADGDVFQVEITNNNEKYLSYSVAFFSLTETEEKLSAPKASIASGEAVAKESKLVLTSEEDAAVYYTVDGSDPVAESTLYTEPISIEADITVKAIAVKEGYENSEIVTFTYTVEEDMPMRYTVTFESNGGTIVPAQSIQENEKVELPKTPIKEGYLFEGWYKEAAWENKWDFEKESVTMDMTLFAKWEENTSETYTINFDLQGQGAPIAAVTVNNGELLTAPDAPTAEGYLFEGWYKEAACINVWDFEADIVETDAILYAKWTETQEETTIMESAYIVTYDMQGVGEQIAPASVQDGELLAKPDVPTAEGYSFAEWYQEAECVNVWNFETDMVTEDIVLYAKWVQDDETVLSASNSREAAEETIDLSAETTATTLSAIKSRVYNGKTYEPNVTVKIFNGKKRVTLKKGKDYTVKYQNNINAGENTGIVIVTGIGKYKGSVQANFTITPKSVKKLKIVTESKRITDASAKVFIYDGTTWLNNNLFTFEFTDPQDPKNAKVKITAKENTNYTGFVTAKLTVYDATKEQLINAARVTMTGDTIYTGKAITRDITVTFGGTELVKNKDYKVQYQNNTNVGVALAVITGKGKYKGKVVLSFNITKANVANAQSVTITPITPKTFNGKEQQPKVTVKTTRKKLTLNKDYTVTYLNNVHQGTATIVIKGTGNNCTGSTNITFKIMPQNIKKASIKVIKGKDGLPNSIALTYNKKTLVEYADYVITEFGEMKNKKIPVTIEGLCDFEGKVTKSLQVDPPEEDSDVLSSAVSTNIQRGNYAFSGCLVHSYLFRNDEDLLTRVEYIGNNEVCVETYSSDWKLANSQRIKMELPKFGGFYAGKDYYFLVYGQENPNEDNNVEVIRIVKYDKNWNRKGAARIFGANTYSPFKNGSLRMVEYDDMLYIRTCHQMYMTYDGQRHQASAAFSVNISDMEVLEQVVGISQTAYVSHSFNQFILLDGSDLLAVDHGDAYPRSIALAKYNKKAGTQNILNGGCSRIGVLPICGKSGSVYTGVSAGGVEASSIAYLTAGNSVEQDPATYSASGIRNIYVTSTLKDNFSGEGNTIRWITNYKYIEYTDANGNPQKTPEATVLTPHLVKINDNEMMLMWTETTTVIENNKPVQTAPIQKSVLLNGTGEPISGIYSFEGPLSDCKPIVEDGNIRWYYTNNSEPVFYSLNIDDVRKQPK